MSSNEEFFESKKAAAVFKHGILKRYPVVFASKAGMSVDNHQVIFLDGYAGRGEYEDGSPGSPLLLSRCAEFVEKYRNVMGIFVERSDDHFENLSRVLEHKGGQMRRKLFHASLDECLPQILRESREAALFTFLDPFGPALDYHLVHSGLLGRPLRPATEVLLHFSVSSVARMGGALRAARTSGRGLSESDQRAANRLDRFLGGDWWQKHFAQVSSTDDERRATDAALQVADHYSAMMAADTGFMAVSMPVRPRPDLLPKYILVLFTRHVEGLWCFADALGQAGREWNGAWITERLTREGAPNQPSLFDVDEPEVQFDSNRYEQEHRDKWVATISENILRLLSAQGPFRLADQVLAVYGDVLGSAWTRHVRAAVQGLNQAGAISSNGKGKRFHYEIIRPG